MSDMFEEFKRAASGPGDGVGDALRRADAGVAARSIAKGRRRRVAGEGAVAAVAVGALAVAGWGLTSIGGGAATPAATPTFDEDGAITVYPSNYDGALCNQVDGAAGAYVPLGEQGVHLVGRAADELNLEVTGTLVSGPAGGPSTELARGEYEFSEPNDDGGATPSVQFYASWDGDARLSIDTAAYLVVDGWTVTRSWQYNSDTLGAQPWIDNPAPAYDDASGRSSLAASNALNTECVMPVDAGLPGAFVYPGGPGEVHTVVQVRDENGVVIAQYFDALEADGSVVTFDGLKDDPGAVELPEVTDADREQLVAWRAAKTTEQAAGVADDAVTGSSEADDMLAKEGQPLAEIGQGHRVRNTCEAATELLSLEGDTLQVVPGDFETPPVPSVWPASDFASEYGAVPLDPEDIATYGDADWYIGHEVQVFFTDPSNPASVLGQVTGVFGWTGEQESGAPDPTTGVFLFPVESPCDDTAGLEPGDYRAIVSVHGSPDGIRELYEADTQFAETWFDLGEVTVTP